MEEDVESISDLANKEVIKEEKTEDKDKEDVEFEESSSKKRVRN